MTVLLEEVTALLKHLDLMLSDIGQAKTHLQKGLKLLETPPVRFWTDIYLDIADTQVDFMTFFCKKCCHTKN